MIAYYFVPIIFLSITLSADCFSLVPMDAMDPGLIDSNSFYVRMPGRSSTMKFYVGKTVGFLINCVVSEHTSYEDGIL